MEIGVILGSIEDIRDIKELIEDGKIYVDYGNEMYFVNDESAFETLEKYYHENFVSDDFELHEPKGVISFIQDYFTDHEMRLEAEGIMDITIKSNNDDVYCYLVKNLSVIEKKLLSSKDIFDVLVEYLEKGMKETIKKILYNAISEVDDLEIE